MEFVKYNQLLKIRVEYDQDYGQIGFNDFIEDNGLERLSDWEWLKFGNPEAMHFTPEDLKTPTDVYEALEAYIGRYATPADFCEEFCEEVESEALDALPNYLKFCIDWAAVWDTALCHDYFEYSGYYFRNV